MNVAIVALPALVAVVGALVYALSANPKLAQMGLVAYACGLLVALFRAASEVVKL